jgi:trimeric autotransporter adhesin
MNTLILQFKKLTPLRLIVFALACFALSPAAIALLPPPAPDGGYPGGNTAEGHNALHDVNTAVGINNTAVGFNALTNNTTGQYNVAIGSGALFNNTTGDFNMAVGTEALAHSNGTFNLAIGFRTLFLNTTGNHLTGIGAAALRNNTTGTFNTAIGSGALGKNTTADANTAIGANALSNNDSTGQGSAIENTAVGNGALINNVGGSDNTAVGYFAGQNLTYGFNNIYIGQRVAFGVDAYESNTIRIGSAPDGVNVTLACYIEGIAGEFVDPTGAGQVYVDNNGKLGVFLSSERFKRDIEPMGKTSEAIFALKPVTFRYKNDTKKTPCFGLIAENVEKMNPDLVARDKEGKASSVRYEQVNAMLLNEFLKEHRTVQEQQKEIDSLRAELKEQKALIQKVSDKVELDKPAPQTVLNNQ